LTLIFADSIKLSRQESSGSSRDREAEATKGDTMTDQGQLDQLCINTLRMLSIDAPSRFTAYESHASH
jgi:hypothetical protein